MREEYLERRRGCFKAGKSFLQNRSQKFVIDSKVEKQEFLPRRYFTFIEKSKFQETRLLQKRKLLLHFCLSLIFFSVFYCSEGLRYVRYIPGNQIYLCNFPLLPTSISPTYSRSSHFITLCIEIKTLHSISPKAKRNFFPASWALKKRNHFVSIFGSRHLRKTLSTFVSSFQSKTN